jgi:YidC/Oxa1 family membrane protein insertase
VKLPRLNRAWIGPILPIAIIVLVAVACAGLPGAPVASGSSPGPSVSPSPIPSPTPLHPAGPAADPVGLLAFVFTPIFQALFILLVAFYKFTGDIGIAIILLTIVIRALLIPLFRKQTVSQKQMQLLQPELREIQKRYKGDRQKASQAQQELYRERGMNPLSGCLPLLLQMPLLFIMYQVIRDGLTNYDITPMLSVFGTKLVDVSCPAVPIMTAQHLPVPCINTTVAWLGGLDVGQPHVDFTLVFGVSYLAIFSALLQVLQSRMALPPVDAKLQDSNTRIQRQTMLILPLIFVVYANFLPAGLYIYYIVTTIFGIVQQYFIMGFGSLFPLFGWNPAFAQNHTPRFPVAAPAPIQSTRTAGAPTRPSSEDRAKKAAATVRTRERGRQSRRGRRR